MKLSHYLRQRRLRLATTTEQRLWTFIAEQAKDLYEIASGDDLHTRKQSLAGDPFHKIRQALEQLGVTW
jgi:hypothetical protein